jgi:hypothetical protein
MIYKAESSKPALVTRDEIDGVMLVAGWFRKHASERQRVLKPRAALDECVGA